MNRSKISNSDWAKISKFNARLSTINRVWTDDTGFLHMDLTVGKDKDWVAPSPKSVAELHATRAHPDYEYGTTEGPRKHWYGAELPPEGEGWERNVDAGRNGWERFDYTEESYWRRKRNGSTTP